MTTFAVVNERTLVAAIDSCKSRLVYIAPGITGPIVTAMKLLMLRTEPPALTIIIDANPEVCRLGYGTVDGLKALQSLAAEQMLPVRYQEGLRVGVLVCDEQIQVYSPTPLLIEVGSDRNDQPNAIQLGNANVLSQLLAASAAEGESVNDVPLVADAEIGKKSASAELLKESIEDLERLPPKQFDVARTERVFSSKLQYVDFEVTGYRLTNRRVQVPTDLLVGSDKTLEARLRNTFSLLDGKEALTVEIQSVDPKTGEVKKDQYGKPVMEKYSEKSIEEDRKNIYSDFLTSISGHGQLISKVRRPDFDRRLNWFKARVDDYSKAVQTMLAKSVDESIDRLAGSLLPSVMQHKPPRLMKHQVTTEISEAEMRDIIRRELEKAFNPGDGFFKPSVRVVFKDITYETINDSGFREKLTTAFAGLEQKGIEGLFDEHDAAPEKMTEK